MVKDKQLSMMNAWDIWQAARDTGTPEGQVPVKNKKGAPPARFLDPKDIMSLIQASSPWDLYLRPNESADNVTPGSAAAFNLHNNALDAGVPEAIVFPNKYDPVRNMDSIASLPPDLYSDIAPELHKYIAQAMYEHEAGHASDPRLLPYKDGYKSSEKLAMNAEDNFWNKMRYDQWKKKRG